MTQDTASPPARKRTTRAVIAGTMLVAVLGASAIFAGSSFDSQLETEALPPDTGSSANSSPTSTPTPRATASATPTPTPTPTPVETAPPASGNTARATTQQRAAVTPAAATGISSYRQDWGTPTRVNRVALSVPAGSVANGTLTFSDGSRLLITPDAAGDATVSFPERSVTSAVITLNNANGLAVNAVADVWAVSFTGTSPTNAASTNPQNATATTSSNGGGVGANVLLDGNPSTGALGNEWAANPTDVNASATLSWPSVQEIASVQMIGPSSTAFDPAYSAAAELYGELVFDDGSVVPVSGIDAGQGQPTTVAFTPRMTTSVRLDLHPTITQAKAGLREFRAYPRGVTPPQWSGGLTAPGRAVSPTSSAGCSATSTAFGSTTDGSMALVCPAVGSSVSDTATVVVTAPAGSTVDVAAWVVDGAGVGSQQRIVTATANPQGRAVLQFSTASLMRGPFALRVATRGVTGTAGNPLYVQLYNTGGRVPAGQTSFAPAGMTLQYADEFTSPLSITQSGEGSTYAATKPAYWGNSEFGEALFANPAWGRDTMATLAGDYLRIRAQPISRTDPWGWNRQHESGLVSSLKVGATGFAAQYGYFEARILAPAGRGSWPAFWMINADAATMRAATDFGEVDAVELYGHDATASCHSLHSWLNGADVDSDVQCLWPNGAGDWATQWHTYGVQIKPNGADYYVDGRLVKSLTGLSQSSDPYYFMLNQSLGGGYPIRIGGVGNTLDMYVDWVRVYS